MSKWGFVSKHTAKEKFERQPDEACEMVVDMATTIIEQEKEIAALNKNIQDFQMQRIGDLGTIAELTGEKGRLEGYRDRVREIDSQATRGVPSGTFTLTPTEGQKP